eukprot:15480297-Alexandrium_andersonii.AAC.1
MASRIGVPDGSEIQVVIQKSPSENFREPRRSFRKSRSGVLASDRRPTIAFVAAPPVARTLLPTSSVSSLAYTPFASLKSWWSGWAGCLLGLLLLLLRGPGGARGRSLAHGAHWAFCYCGACLAHGSHGFVEPVAVRARLVQAWRGQHRIWQFKNFAKMSRSLRCCSLEV